jgi:predicted ABC-type ATPase
MPRVPVLLNIKRIKLFVLVLLSALLFGGLLPNLRINSSAVNPADIPLVTKNRPPHLSHYGDQHNQDQAIAAEISAPAKSKQSPSTDRTIDRAVDPRLDIAKKQRQLVVTRMLQEAQQWQFDPCGEGTACYDHIQKYAREIDALDTFIAELEPDYSPWRDGLTSMVDPRVDRNGTLTQYEDSIERQLLYEYLVAQRLGKSSSQSEMLEATLTMGGPGSGKSTVLRQLDLCQTGTIINADEFKADFVEYQVALAAKDRLAASRVHEESSILSRRTRNESIQTKRSFCWDGTLSDGAEALRLIKILQNRGYAVTVIGAMLPTRVGVERVIARGERTGRFVPLEVVTDAYDKIAQHAEEVVMVADRGYLYDTNVAYGKEPILVAHFEKGKSLFRNAEYLQRLKAGEL